MQYAKDGKRESYSCPSLLRQDNTSEVTVSQSQRVNVSSLLIIIMCVMWIGRSSDARIPVSFPDSGGSFIVRVVRSDWN